MEKKSNSLVQLTFPQFLMHQKENRKRKTHTHNSTERRGKPSGSQKDERSGSSELLVRVNVKKRRQSKKQREQLTPSLDYTWNEMMENKNKGEGGEKE